MEVWRMFYDLNLYWLSCNNSCGESSSSFEHAKNWWIEEETGYWSVSIDWCEVYERLGVRFEVKIINSRNKIFKIFFE